MNRNGEEKDLKRRARGETGIPQGSPSEEQEERPLTFQPGLDDPGKLTTFLKGVVATYRMTNRPPPTQASPYVATILRPLKEFSRDFELRTPDQIGNKWKISILTVVTEKYGSAVEELISTVQRTESALQNRRARGRATSGGISDGDKVKLQLYLDFEAFCRDVQEVGVTPSSIEGISKLQELTQEAQKIQE